MSAGRFNPESYDTGTLQGALQFEVLLKQALNALQHNSWEDDEIDRFAALITDNKVLFRDAKDILPILRQPLDANLEGRFTESNVRLYKQIHGYRSSCGNGVIFRNKDSTAEADLLGRQLFSERMTGPAARLLGPDSERGKRFHNHADGMRSVLRDMLDQPNEGGPKETLTFIPGLLISGKDNKGKGRDGKGRDSKGEAAG